MFRSLGFGWLSYSFKCLGFLKFVDSILALPDVYFVTSQELIAWTRFPEPLPQVDR